MQDFAELHLKPETLARHDFSLGIELMIAGIDIPPCTIQRLAPVVKVRVAVLWSLRRGGSHNATHKNIKKAP